MTYINTETDEIVPLSPIMALLLGEHLASVPSKEPLERKGLLTLLERNSTLVRKLFV